MKKNIVLCADDYGQAPAISKGIISLLERGRLSAVSCMVNGSGWNEEAEWLKAYSEQADIGLHFNLTEGAPLSESFKQVYGETLIPLSTLLRKAFLRQLDPRVMADECRAQINQFERSFGRLPRFLDGHQHVHQFPIIRQAVAAVYESHLRANQTYVRWVNPKIKLNLKKFIIYATGSLGQKSLLRKHHIPHNTSFAGIYSFTKVPSYAHLFTRFLAEVSDGGLIMCHPGLASSDPKDAIAEARYIEYQYFLSTGFLEDCRAHNAVLQRFF